MANVAFHSVPASRYPFDIYAYPEGSVMDVEPLWTRHVEGPGILSVPGMHETGMRVRLVIRWADGTVER